MSRPPLLSLADVTFEAGGRPVLTHVTWSIGSDEQWAVVGPNGAGKSLLLRGLAGGLVVREGRLRHHFLEDDARCRDSTHGVLPYGTIALAASPAARTKAAPAASFHQARWHASEGHGRRVGDLLTYASVEAVNPFRVDAPEVDLAAFEQERQRVIEDLGLDPLLARRVLELSQGERRLMLLARALCRAPRLLLVDDPYTGLDATRRERVRGVLAGRVARGRKVVLAPRRTDEVPDWATHVLFLDALRVAEAVPRAQVRLRAPEGPPPEPEVGPPAGHAPGLTPGEPLIEVHGAHVRYGAETILDGIDWTVRSGEHWAVVGANGAGKSTLLSLITGDNPQAYANDVRLFGRRRGSGETIWELRRRIGWMGPELDAHFPAVTRLLDVVCSGFSGTLGRVEHTDPEQLARARELLRLFAIEELAHRAFGQMPDAERRLALIARALVHGPGLLVLDEPCQGLDGAHVTVVRDAVDAAAAHGVASVVYVTHDARERPLCISHVLVLEGGRVARQGASGSRLA